MLLCVRTAVAAAKGDAIMKNTHTYDTTMYEKSRIVCVLITYIFSYIGMVFNVFKPGGCVLFVPPLDLRAEQ